MKKKIVYAITLLLMAFFLHGHTHNHAQTQSNLLYLHTWNLLQKLNIWRIHKHIYKLKLGQELEPKNTKT